jgi:DNA-binding response OmpR family regulator
LNRFTSVRHNPARWQSTVTKPWGSIEGAPRILIVDDDASLLSLLRILLTSAGYQVQTAVDGQQALMVAAMYEFDVILLDLEMPVMNGREFFGEYRNRGNQTPVVVVSAYGAEAARAELGAEGAVAKPFDPDNVTHLIDRILGRGSP